jgi:hypothetical protein
VFRTCFNHIDRAAAAIAAALTGTAGEAIHPASSRDTGDRERSVGRRQTPVGRLRRGPAPEGT